MYKYGYFIKIDKKGSLFKTYNCWESMKQRCLNPKCNSYFRYGERGITVCDRWLDFHNFLSDMGKKPKGKTLDRIDSAGNYEPSNCRWATPKQQSLNKIKSYIPFNGEIVTVSSLVKKYKIRYGKFHSRIHSGWTLRQALGIEKRTPNCTDFEVPDINRVGKILWLRKKGCTMEDIGNYFGVTRQRVEQIIRRNKENFIRK